MARVKFLWTLLRAQHWWNYKLPLAAMVMFMTAAPFRLPAGQLVLPLFLLLLSGISTAIFASVVNDVTDLDEDLQAGKATPLMALAAPQRVALLVGSVLIAVAVGCILSFNTTVLATYVAIIGSFVFYSLRPIRLKGRGVLGAACIAAGEHMLPACLAMSLLSASTGCAISERWCALVMVWALCFGMRGIIWHQLSDANSDARNACETFAVSSGSARVRRFGELVVFPVETMCSAAMIWLASEPLLWLFFIPYTVSDFLHFRYFKSEPIIVQPQQYGRFVWFDFYRLFCPMGLIVLSATRQPAYMALLAVYAVCFAGPICLIGRNLGHLLKHRTFPFALQKLDRREPSLSKFAALVEEDIPSVH